MQSLEQETPENSWEVETLLDLCFAPGREALSSYRLREGVAPLHDLCRFWRDEAGMVGAAIRCWPVRIAGHDAILLGPVAVHPTQQGTGLGRMLMHAVIEHARGQGAERIILVGDHAYYQRFGFEKLDDVRMPPPTNPDRVLGCSLTPNAWQGIAGPVERAL